MTFNLRANIRLLLDLKFTLRPTKSEALRKGQAQRMNFKLDKMKNPKDGSGQQGEFANVSYLMFSAGMSNRLLAMLGR